MNTPNTPAGRAEEMKAIDADFVIYHNGLVTRCWTYHTKYGYGCSECCNGDRCDEDCTAKYRRPNCPHCDHGWINPDKPLSEAQEEIKRLKTQLEESLLLYQNQVNTIVKLQEENARLKDTLAKFTAATEHLIKRLIK